MAEEIPPELRIKAALGCVSMGLQSMAEAVTKDNLGSFKRWTEYFYKEALPLLESEIEKYIAWKLAPPASLKDRLKKDTEN